MSKIAPPKKFVGLHAHDGFSTFDGMGLPQEHFNFVIENVKESGQRPALAITNHGNMNSFAHAYLYSKELRKQGSDFKFIPGCEVYLHPDLDEWRRIKADRDLGKVVKEDSQHGSTVENEEESKQKRTYDPIKRRHHLVVLAKTSKGLQNLFSTVSRGYLEGFYRFPRIDYSMLREHKGDFVISTACIAGPLSHDIYSAFPDVGFFDLLPSLVDDPSVRERILQKMENTVDRLVDVAGSENVNLEIQFNKLPAQHLTNRMLFELAERTGLPLLATADSHYCQPDYWKERAIYKNIGWLNYKEYDPSKLPQSVDDLMDEPYPKNALQMWEAYRATTEGFDFYDDKLVKGAIERSHDLAFDVIGDIEPDVSIKLPSWSVPEGKTPGEALREACHEGMEKMGLAGKKEYEERLEFELKVIEGREFCEYFLTMKQIMDLAADHMLTGCGRGSGAGSLVNYVLGITQVNPLRYELIFERFISKHRQEMPDIDSDVADRDLLIKLLKKRYGNNDVLPISNYNTFQLKSLVKDISRFFGIPFSEVNDATKTLDRDVRKAVFKPGMDKNLFQLKYDDAFKHCVPFREFIERHPYVGEPIKVLYKENKSLGKHAGGVLLADDIPSQMPVILSKKEPQTPWVEGMHYKHLEHLGWIKFDLLGLETLRIIERSIELILQRHGGIDKPTFKDVKDWYDRHLHPDILNMDDQHVYEHIYHDGRWGGVFQCTAKGAQKFFQSLKPRNIVELATATSIYRPGPLEGKVHKTYIAAKENPESVVYEHELLKQALEETYGHIIFQEQLMKLGHVVGGLDLDDCDKLRKVITKRSASGASKAKVEAKILEGIFVKGAKERGFDSKLSLEIFDKMDAFSGYGFNKSHAVSYAIDSYMCAWLLTYYEPEWLCAYMETQANNPEKRAKAISELRAFGYEIVGVDINHASDKWTIMPDKKFMPSFLTVKGVGNAAVEEIERHRPYTSVRDLLWNEDGSWKHSKFNKRAMENLIKIRAFESMGIVGPDGTFSSYRQMKMCVIDDMHKLKSKKKGRDELEERIQGSHGTEEWTKDDLVFMSKELVGSADLSLIISSRLRDRLREIKIPCIDEFDGKDGLFWFIVDEANPKLTRNKRPYLQLQIMGLDGKRHRCNVWGWNPQTHDMVMANVPYMAEINHNDWGFSTKVFKLKSMRERSDEGPIS